MSVHVKVAGAWTEIGATPAAPPTSATGGTETTYVGDGTNGENGVNYRVHTFTGNGTLTVSSSGEADVLVVGGGYAPGSNGEGGGAQAHEIRTILPAGALTVVVGAGGSAITPSRPSYLANVAYAASSFQSMGLALAYGAAGASGKSAVRADGWKSYITGTLVEYAQAGDRNATTPGSPGAYPSAIAQAGIVVVRYEI
jgi:hypothetical protein